MLIIPLHPLFSAMGEVEFTHAEVIFSRGQAYIGRSSAVLTRRQSNGDLDYSQAEMAERLDLLVEEVPLLEVWVAKALKNTQVRRFLLQIETPNSFDLVAEILLPLADRLTIISRRAETLTQAHHSSGFQTGVILGSLHPNLA